MMAFAQNASVVRDVIIPIVAAILGGVGGIVVMALKLRQNRRVAAAAFLDAVTAALAGMVRSFRAGEIPFEDGHTFVKLIDHYGKRLRPYLGDEAKANIDRLKVLREKAEDIDQHFEDLIERDVLGDEAYSARELDLAEREEWLTNMQRMVGDLRGQARIIDPTKGNANN